MQGTIQATKTSKSGKSLGVCIGDKWYSSKAFEMAGLQGKEITFTTSHQAFQDGGGIDWINDYTEVGAVPNTADQVMNQAMAQQPPPMGSPQPPQSAPAPQTAQTSTKDRDSFIAAQALCKTLTFQSAKDALNAFKYLYIQLRDWNPEAAADEGTPFDDSIPF